LIDGRGVHLEDVPVPCVVVKERPASAPRVVSAPSASFGIGVTKINQSAVGAVDHPVKGMVTVWPAGTAYQSWGTVTLV
jgi:hypothetical protein